MTHDEYDVRGHLTLTQKLTAIQNEIHAPKNLYNSFGKYSYRNAESIQEALKPLCKKYGVSVYIYDEIELIGDRFYVKATCFMEDNENDCAPIMATAYAREADEKKGMDEAQITGATSSYARKYALNGLLLLDDTKDMDSDEYTAKTTGQQMPPKRATLNEKQVAYVRGEIATKGITEAVVAKSYGVEKIEDIAADQYNDLIKRLKATKEKQA